MTGSQPVDPVSAALPDDSGCTILHVDMDAFYAAVELRRRPDLIGKPVVVGAVGNRGVVLSATYEARSFGVSGGMPISRARRLCPQAVYLAPDFAAYQEVSQGVMAIFRDITPLVSPISLDEAFLDVSGARRRLGTARQIAAAIKARVVDEQGIVASVGVASTMFVAKLASTRSKPDGLLVVPADKVLEFLHPLPVGALWGVGEKTEKVLARHGLATVGQLAETPLDVLCAAIGNATGRHLHALAWGRDERPMTPHEPERSIGAEETFRDDIGDPELIKRELLRLSDRTARRLRAAGAKSKTISIKLRFSDFRTITRSRTLREPTDVGELIFATARELYEAQGLGNAPLRLVGVRAEALVMATDQPTQLSLETRPEAREAAERAMDAASARFGSRAVRPGSLVDPPQPPASADGRENSG